MQEFTAYPIDNIDNTVETTETGVNHIRFCRPELEKAGIPLVQGTVFTANSRQWRISGIAVDDFLILWPCVTVDNK